MEAIDRVPPQRVHLEGLVLGACMLGGAQALDRARAILRPEAFYHTSNRKIYGAIVSLADRGSPVDQASVYEELSRHGVAEDAGGPARIAEMVGDVVSDANLEHHAELVLECYLRRSLIQRAAQIEAMCYEESEELADIAAAAYHLTEEVELASYEVWGQLEKATEGAYGQAEAAREDPEGAHGVTTGLKRLDDLLNGLQDGDLILIAARPSMGKTALGLHMARSAAASVPVGFVSVEMSAQSIGVRVLAAEARVDSHKMRRGRLDDYGWRALVDAKESMRGIKMFVADRLYRPSQIAVEARKLKRQHGIGLLVVDYLQLLTPDGGSRNDNREREVASIGEALKNLAVDMGIPVVALAQLSRAVESRQNKRPMLADLRESGSLEQAADVVAFLYRDDYYGIEVRKDDDGTEVSTEHLCEIIVGKQRNGPIGRIDAYFDKASGVFGDWEEQREVPDWVDAP